MKPTNESFEETQRRILGKPPTLADRLAMLRAKGKLLSALIPSIFTAIVPTLILSDVLEELELPLYVFVALGGIIFLVVFLQILYRETSAPDP